MEIIIPTLGFSNHFKVPSKGFDGGIWVLWDANVVTVEIVAYSTQAVHAIISFNDTGEWLFSVAYASDYIQKRAMYTPKCRWSAYNTR